MYMCSRSTTFYSWKRIKIRIRICLLNSNIKRVYFPLEFENCLIHSLFLIWTFTRMLLNDPLIILRSPAKMLILLSICLKTKFQIIFQQEILHIYILYNFLKLRIVSLNHIEWTFNVCFIFYSYNCTICI